MGNRCSGRGPGGGVLNSPTTSLGGSGLQLHSEMNWRGRAGCFPISRSEPARPPACRSCSAQMSREICNNYRNVTCSHLFFTRPGTLAVTVVEVSALMSPEMLVEIEATAVISD